MTTPTRPQQQQTVPPPQQRFFSFFQHEITDLQDQIGQLASVPTVGGEQSDAADHVLAGISRLSTEVKEASSYLPAYDQRTYSAAIKALEEKLQDTKAAFAPKPKFSFKSRSRPTGTAAAAAPPPPPPTGYKSPSAISLSDAAELAAQKRKAAAASAGYYQPASTTASSTINTPFAASTATTPPLQQLPLQPPHESSSSKPILSTSSTSITISNQTSSHLILPAATSVSPPPPCTLSHLTSCVVNLLPPPPSTTTATTATAAATTATTTAAAATTATTTAAAAAAAARSSFPSLTINHITTSLLVLGHIAGPTHITGLSKSTIVLSTHQLRIHNSRHLRIYLHCTSRPIIENCTDIVFSPLPATAASLLGLPNSAAQPDSQETEKEEQQEQSQFWCQVDDFQWLKPAASATGTTSSSQSQSQSPNWSIDPNTKDIDSIWAKITIDTAGSDGNGSGSGDAGYSVVRDILAAAGIQ